jgi:hypothetical protein
MGHTHICYFYLSREHYKIVCSSYGIWNASSVPTLCNVLPAADHSKLVAGQSTTVPAVHCAQDTTSSQAELRKKEYVQAWT